MNSEVRLIKRGRDDGPKRLPPTRNEKADRQSEREIASTVKRWIAEWEQRRRSDERYRFERSDPIDDELPLPSPQRREELALLFSHGRPLSQLIIEDREGR